MSDYFSLFTDALSGFRKGAQDTSDRRRTLEAQDEASAYKARAEQRDIDATAFDQKYKTATSNRLDSQIKLQQDARELEMGQRERQAGNAPRLQEQVQEQIKAIQDRVNKLNEEKSKALMANTDPTNPGLVLIQQQIDQATDDLGKLNQQAAYLDMSPEDQQAQANNVAEARRIQQLGSTDPEAAKTEAYNQALAGNPLFSNMVPMATKWRTITDARTNLAELDKKIAADPNNVALKDEADKHVETLKDAGEISRTAPRTKKDEFMVDLKDRMTPSTGILDSASRTLDTAKDLFGAGPASKYKNEIETWYNAKGIKGKDRTLDYHIRTDPTNAVIYILDNADLKTQQSFLGYLDSIPAKAVTQSASKQLMNRDLSAKYSL